MTVSVYLLFSKAPPTSHPSFSASKRETRRLATFYISILDPPTPTHLAYPLTLYTRRLKARSLRSSELPTTSSPSPPPQTTCTHHSCFILLPCHHERCSLFEHTKHRQHPHQDKVGAEMSRNTGRTQHHPGLIPRLLCSTPDGMGMRPHNN